MSLIKGFIYILSGKVKDCDEPSHNLRQLEVFTLTKPLPIKLESYVDHFLYQLRLPEEILIIGYLLLENLFESITMYNLHRLVFACLSLSYKFCIDKPVFNSMLEKVGGLRTNELAKLEAALLIENQ